MMENVLFKDSALKAKICWSNPVLYDECLNENCCIIETDNINYNYFEDYDNDFWVNDFYNVKSNFYMIIGQWGLYTRLFYIGKTTKNVLNRLKQQDHKRRKREIKKDWPKYKLLVSFGNLYMELGCNKTSKRVDNIESLLIYAHEPEYNKSKIFKHSVDSDYWIKNYGYVDPLYKQLHYGLIFGD